MSPAKPIHAEIAATRRWLSIVGIGEDGIDGLSPAARSLISSAEIVFGGKRHLALAATLIRGAARPWPTPFERGIEEVLAHRGRRACVLASGDPYFYGVGSLLARRVSLEDMVVLPAPSAFSLAAARLGWALAETALMSVHGRALDLVRPHLQPGARVLALTSDGAAPAALARLLTQLGFGTSRLTVLEALGARRERVRSTTAVDFALADIDDINTVGIEVFAGSDARIIARSSGLPDDLFEHDGAITKREVRAITLSALAPRRGELLWDIGAGAGSIAIEWMLSDPLMQAIAVETRADRIAYIRRNAAGFGVPGLQIIEGRAPAALEGLPAPDAIFIGGGAAEPGLVEAAIAALRSSGRLVINAVTLETESRILAWHSRVGGELMRAAIARATPLAGKTGWRPAMPITQWTWVKS